MKIQRQDQTSQSLTRLFGPSESKQKKKKQKNYQSCKQEKNTNFKKVTLNNERNILS